MAEREYNYVIVKCPSEADAIEVIDNIVDVFEYVWPSLAYDDGFGHIVRKDESSGASDHD